MELISSLNIKIIKISSFRGISNIGMLHCKLKFFPELSYEIDEHDFQHPFYLLY